MSDKTAHIASLYKPMQLEMCHILGQADSAGTFKQHAWEKEIGSGLTCVMQQGAIIEKGAINFSHVQGHFTPALERALGMSAKSYQATGISSILHPKNPWVPIIHMNVRFFELDNGASWFGGGIDLTPHYIIPDDAGIFHHALKKVCDAYSENFYPEFKAWADDYFYLPHRSETRGVGGIFFDRIAPKRYKLSHEQMIDFSLDLCRLYPVFYSSLMKKHGAKKFTSDEKHWQKVRRSRYVEFNLLYDRGTKFGLESKGNTESILLSMPPEAAWEYNYIPAEGSEEHRTQALLKKEIDWLCMND